ncbi:fatty acid synthase-like [Paramacrobiotus metropolitanus]|uniref:fatty acid synthase-like n=1 Tax=Paramacrobiotus metropolitanus TaxID=2943436 RepID=UPI002445B32E|nr:fatty acid synthase-like [Paramacrobiotus metropolitanus]
MHRPINNAEVEDPEDIVISGIGIRCAMSDNVEEFADNLFNSVNMVHENLERCDEDHFGVPKQQGFIKDIRKFDATFFGVHPKQADGMDPQLRILHEVAYECLVDAAIDPASLKNSNTGVFIGTSNSDAREAWTAPDVSEIDGYSLIGTHRAFLANRLSFTFDLRGPSFGVDAACATSGVAINQGYLHIRNGVCDAAIVGGVSLVYQPKVSYQILKLGLLCRDGKCKVFDEAADGYVRAEAIACAMLQKRKDAKRVLATLIHSKINNDGFKEQGITFPSTESQGQLVCEVYAEAGIDPEDVEYVEAHGTGTTIGDPQETNGIAMGFVNARTKPLLIGAVKSNMGHSEHASGVVSLAKIMIAMQAGVIPPNMNYKNPNPLIPALVDGRLKVITEPTKWNCTIAGLNCFGFGGQNSHLVVRGNPRTRHDTISEPRLFVYMGRTEEAAQTAMQYALKHQDNPYVSYLLMQTAFTKPAAMPYRGYCLLNSPKGDPAIHVDRVTTEVKPVWYVFSGQGTQWASMGREMLKLDAFRKSIDKCAHALKPHGLDLIKLLAHSTDADYEDPTVSFVGIAAIQVALVDLLTAMKIDAQGFVGHSAGEIGCAYADGSFTAEEAVLAAYFRGRAVINAKQQAGAMAAVGLPWAEAQKRCRGDVVPACNNAKDNVTVSGPADQVAALVNELKAQNVFAKEVNSYGIAFHSPAMKAAAPEYLASLKKLLPSPKMRTTRWLSTAVEEAQWGSEVARYASAEYFTHNLTNTVKFHEALSKVPSNAIVVEIAPHGLLQALIKATVGSQATPVALMKKGADELFFLESIGKLYVAGLNPRVTEIFPKPTLPAPRDTPFIGSVVRWDHSANWRIPYPTDFIHKGGKGGAHHTYTYDLNDPLNVRLFDNKVGRQPVFSVGAYLNMTAKAFAAETGNTIEKAPRVHFSDVEIRKTLPLTPGAKMAFDVSVTKSTGYFEINHNGETIVTGTVGVADAFNTHLSEDIPDHTDARLDRHTTYNELRQRGYNYGPQFQLLKNTNEHGTRAHITSPAGYDGAVDALIQLLVLSQNSRDLVVPTEIGSVTLDISKLSSALQSDGTLPATVYPEMGIATCPGAEIEGVLLAPVTGDFQATHQYSVKEHGFLANSGSVHRTDAEHRYVQDYLRVLTDYLHTESDRLVRSGASSTIFKEIAASRGSTGKTVSPATDPFSHEPRATLYNLLRQVFEAVNHRHPGTPVDDVIRRTVTSLRPTLKDDLLLNTLTKRSVMQPVLDVALENTDDDVVQILELLRGDQPSKSADIVTDLTSPHDAPVEFKSLAVKAGQQTEIHPGSATILVADTYFTNGLQALPGDLKTISTILKDDGYLLAVQPFDGPVNELATFIASVEAKNGPTRFPTYEQFRQALQAEGFAVVLEKEDGVFNRMILARKTTAEPPTKHHSVYLNERSTLDQHADHVSEELTRHFKDLDTDASSDSRVWLVAPRGRTDLASVLTHPKIREHPHASRLRFVGDRSTTGNGLPKFSTAAPFDRVLAGDLRYNVHDGRNWGTTRNVPFTSDVLTDATTAVAHDTFEWHEGPVQHAAANKETIAVTYATVNKDKKLVAFAGQTVPRGEPVVGTVPATKVATHVAVHPEDVVPLPKGLSARDAATVVFPYSVAYYALSHLARVNKGHSVLVHFDEAAPAQSEAVLRTAVLLGADVFASGSVPEHVARLPQLQGRVLTSLHDKNAAARILQATGGRGVSVIVNTGRSSRLQESARVIAPNGTYLETSKVTAGDRSKAAVNKNITVYKNVADAVTRLDGPTKQPVTAFLAQALSRGDIAPLPLRLVRSLKDINTVTDEAVVLDVRGENTAPIKATPKAHFSANKTYVVVGESEEVLVGLAYWLTTRGARLIQLSSQANVGPVLNRERRFFESQGVEINVNNGQTAEALLQTAASRAPLGGVFVLDHVNFNQRQTPPSKINVTDLDRAVRNVAKDSLDFFVVLTSVLHQGASTAENVVDSRSAAGLPAQIVQVGNVVFHKNDPDHPDTTEEDHKAISLPTLFDALTDIVRRPVTTAVISPPPAVHRQRTAAFDEDGSGPQDKSYLPQAVAKIMGIKDFGALDMFLSLGDYGIDSLMAMELGKILERDFNLSLTLQEIRSLCVRDICLMSGATNAVEAAKFSENKTLSEVPTLLDTVKKHYNLNELVPKETVTLLRQVKERNDTLFIVHPMEGSVLPVLEALANHLQVTTYGLNCTQTSDMTSMQTLAASYIKALKQVQSHGPYNLGGYSFGAGVAFEMALQLQKEDPKSVRNLVLLDGSHSFVGAFTKTMKGGYTVDPNMPLDEMNKRKQTAFEVAIFVLYVTQLVKTQRKQLTEKLQAARSFEERVDVTAQELQRCPQLSHIPLETLRTAAVQFAERLMVADVYKPTGKYNGPLTLVKCSEKMIRNLGEYYELDKVVEHRDKIRAVTVNGNHEGFVLGESAKLTANYINESVLSH